MPVELTQVLLAILLAFAQLMLFAVYANLEIGLEFTGGPRDEAPPKEVSKTTGRMQRAFQNMNETLPWFIGVVVVAHLSNQVDAVVIAAGWIYLIARLIYVPVYVIHIGLLRSAVWAVATGAIMVILFKSIF